MKTKLMLVLLLVNIYILSFSQISQGGKPLTFYQEYSELFRKQLKSAESSNSGEVTIQGINKVQEKEKVKEFIGNCENCRSKKYYGKEVEININFFDKAQMIKHGNGDRLWLLKIKSEDAEGFQFLFDKFYLPEGCKIFFYNEEKKMSLGAFTSLNNREDGEFVTQYINGNNIYIELFIPNIAKEKPILSLNKVVYIFDDIFRDGPYSKDGSDFCNINASCFQGIGWNSEIKSVALILEKNGLFYWGVCTGTLINKENNYNDSDKPYFLSANHCYELVEGGYADVKNWVFIFRHETDFCNDDGSGIGDGKARSVVGADIISKDAGSLKSDYLLLKLKNTVGQIRDFNISFAGWNASESGFVTSQAIGIHHPNGDVKKISISNQTPVSSPFQFTGCPGAYTGTENYLKVIWDEGITAEGSSGSPLFNLNHQIIGTLTAGFSYCQNEPTLPCPNINGPQGPDYYGKFSKSWTNGNLKQYLAPSGVNSVGVYEPLPLSKLSITTETNPKNVYLGTSFRVKATSDNGIYPITWFLWINKEPNDFTDYQFGSSNCFNENRTSESKQFESSSSFTMTKIGSYKGKIFAMDTQGTQSTITFSIDIADKKDPCIFTHLYQIDCAKQNEFPKGANIRLYDYVYLINDVTSSPDQCHEIQFIGSEYIQPKYQGISRLQWFYDNSLLKEYNYNTTMDYQYNPGYPNSPIYYYQTGYSQCFTLNTEGEHTLRLDAYGGRMSTDGYQFIHPFNFYNSFSSVSKKFKVIDCDRYILINTKSILNSYNGFIKGGLIIFNPSSSIDINSGETHNVISYREVTFKPGVSIKSGSNFSVKMEECPAYNCDCASTKSTLLDPISQEKNGLTDNIGSRINVYPNPASSMIYIEINEELDGAIRIELINSTGNVVRVNNLANRISEINIEDLPSGLYILKIYCNRKEFMRKVLKN